MKAGDSFKKLGGITPRVNTPKTQGPKNAPSVQDNAPADPTESVSFGQAPAANEKAESFSTTAKEEPTYVAPQTASSSPASIPGEINGLIIAGANKTQKPSFPSLGLHGINSTKLETVGGRTIASVNPLSPKEPVGMPTTSLSAVNDTFGGGPFFSVSGRQLG